MNTVTLEGAPDRTAPRAGIDYGSALRDLASVDPRARSLYALPPWGILVIRCEEKTVIADRVRGERRTTIAASRFRLVSGQFRDIEREDG